jgi:hypothetical protein
VHCYSTLFGLQVAQGLQAGAPSGIQEGEGAASRLGQGGSVRAAILQQLHDLRPVFGQAEGMLEAVLDVHSLTLRDGATLVQT